MRNPENIMAGAATAMGLVLLLSSWVTVTAQTVTQWSVFEKELTSTRTYSSAYKYSGLTLNATFSGPGGETHTVPGFWDGYGTWRVRFAPTAPGAWTYTISSPDTQLSDPANNGGFTCVAPDSAALAANPNLHGFLRNSTDGRGFTYADNTPFFWMGEDNWMANTSRCGYDADPGDLAGHRVPEFRTWIDNRKAKRFNTVMYIAKQWNEGGGPYRSAPTIINPENFQWLDKRVKYVSGAGMVSVLVAAGWETPTFYDATTLTQLKNFWRYLVARYGAYNVVWCQSIEYSYTTGLQKFRDCGNYIKSIDDPGHLITIHPGPDWENTSSSTDFHEDAWLDFNMEQTWSAPERVTAYKDYALSPVKPFVNAEYGYEGLWGMTRTTTRVQAWTVYMCGGAGVNYGAHGIWWWNDGDQDAYLQKQYGSSPRWFEVIDSASSSDMKRIVDFFTAREWWKLSRHDSLVVGGYCLAEPGRQYVLFNPFGPTTTVPGLPVGIDAKWYNPRDGSYRPAGSGPTFTRPTSDDWVLSIDAAGNPVRDLLPTARSGQMQLDISNAPFIKGVGLIHIKGTHDTRPPTAWVLDMQGRRVRTLVPQPANSGGYTMFFNTTHLPAGFYLLKCAINGQFYNKKIILLK